MKHQSAISPAIKNSRIVKNSHASDVISMVSTRKYDYAIQSVPQAIVHTKSAFKDYFQHCQDQQQIVNNFKHEQPTSQKILNNSIIKNQSSSKKDNIYSRCKQILLNTIKTITYKRLKQSIRAIKINEVGDTIRKVPTFKSQSSFISSSKLNKGKTLPEIQIDPPAFLVGRISKQDTKRDGLSSMSASATISPRAKSRTASKYRFLDTQTPQFTGKESTNVIMINKLMMIYGSQTLSEFGNSINLKNSVNNGTMYFQKLTAPINKQKRMFSALNQN